MKCLIFFLFFISLIHCQKTDDSNNTITPVSIIDLDKTIQYKTINNIDDNLLSLDIYYNSDIDTKKPIVVYVHGGGWSIGDKANDIDNKVNLFKELGYVFVSINYRLSPFPNEIDNDTRIKFPIHNIDVADALSWVSKNIDEYGGDFKKIALLGHSAGAHLVALTGTNPQFLEDVGLSISDIKGITIIDTEAFDINEQVTNGGTQNLFVNAFGTDEDIHKEASPLFNLDSENSYPKFFIAKRGNETRIEYADSFIKALEDNNISISEVNGSVYTHAGINEAIGDTNETVVTPALTSFLATCFE